ncbi:lipoprotein N-acyltransferase Lnb domain-containing protein [Flagellimonas sp. 2504JD4-2]
MKHWIFFWVFLLLLVHQALSQIPRLTDKSQISVLTCSKGDDLISAFGHSAFRVQDTTLGIDVVYNYGTFDFDRPNFILNFVKGRLIYSLSRSRFDRFLFSYELERRWMREQILDLTLAEKNQLFAFFENNYLPQNRDYLYDPLLNNCSSIITDILKDQYGDAIVLDGSYLDKQYTFRELVRQNLAENSWSSFGINTAFGSVVDRTASVKEHTFLPYYAMEQLNNTTKDGKPLVMRERVILDYEEFDANNFFPLSPLFWFILLMLFTATITYLDYKHGSRSRWLDFSLLFVTGFIGVVLALIWFAADHTSTPKNFNLLWAFPFNFVVAFTYLFHNKLPDWFSKYLWFALGLIGLTLLVWIFNVQSFSPLLMLILATLAIRYVFLIKFTKV